MGLGPVPATRKLCDRLGLKPSDFDIVELNEAFASQGIAGTAALELSLTAKRRALATMCIDAETRDEVGVVADQAGSPTSALDIADAIFTVARNLVAQLAEKLAKSDYGQYLLRIAQDIAG